MRLRGFFRRSRLPDLALATVVVLGLTVSLAPPATLAADEKQLQRVKGVVGYQASNEGTFTLVVARFLLPDDYLAITREKAAALLALPDSSLVALGGNTRVQVGAFNQSTAGPGATVTVNGGTLRFDIRRPQGGTANYRFVTPTTQVAVRGTVGLLSVIGGNTSVACIACAADSVSVTVGTQTFAVLTGQILTVSAAGAVVTGALTGTVLAGFTAAGVSTSAATGTSAATAGVAGAVAGVSAGTIGAVAAGAAAAAVGVSAATTGTSSTPAPTRPTASPVPIPTASPAPIATASPTPIPTASPSSAPSPSPTASQPTAAPTPIPTASSTVTISGKTRPAAGPRVAPEPPRPIGRRP